MTLRSPSLTDNPLASPSSSGPPGSRAVLRCAGTADFLAVLPFLTGFTDENSLFVVLFRGVRGEDVIRIDLPAPDDRVAERALLTTLIEVLRVTGSGAESPAVVCATARSFEQCGGVPFLRLLRKIERRCVTEGWRLRELAVVASDGWAALLSADPLAQRNLDEIAASPLAVEASEHSHVQPLTNVGDLPETDAKRQAAVAQHLIELHDLDEVRGRSGLREIHGTPVGDTSDSQVPTWVLATIRVAQSCLSVDPEAEPQDPRILARLIEACQHPASWFVVALTLLTEHETAVNGQAAQLVDDVATPVTDIGEIEAALVALSREAIDPAQLRRAATTLSDAAAHAPESAQPAVCALIAWVWWMLGMQSVALRFVQQALQLPGAHDLTHMVERLINQPPQSRLRALREGRVSANAQPDRFQRPRPA
jgi:hypothetical protein